jgi:hypothetical protein
VNRDDATKEPLTFVILSAAKDLAAIATAMLIGMARGPSLRSGRQEYRYLAQGDRNHSAATASPICSQVGAMSETVARRMSRR